VVALSTTGLHFLDLPLERLTSQGVRVTRLDLRTPATDVRLPNLASLTRARLVRAAGGEVEPSWLSPPSATPALEALGTAAAAGGTVFSEWCDRASVWASLVVPPGARLVIRLHSIEALSVAAHLVDWARVDQLVCVSEPLRRLTNEVVPMTRSVPTSVVPNAVSLQRMRGEKPPAADRTLVMVGWAQAVKDPLFALDVLGLLRGHDASWRLMLVGHPFPAKDRARSMAYAAAYEKRRAAADVAGAVDEVPFTDDLPAVLSKAGFVLSVSLRESSAVGLLEAVASGCVPVVRDWPIVSVYGGPGALFPAEWVVAMPIRPRVRRPHEQPRRRYWSATIGLAWHRSTTRCSGDEIVTGQDACG
jgi:glycosyltransferase involved in cell wall biosynthesis